MSTTASKNAALRYSIIYPLSIIFLSLPLNNLLVPLSPSLLSLFFLSCIKLIVFGGPSAPAGEVEAEAFLRKKDFVDVLVSGEGETAFLDLCHAKINGLDLKDVLSLAWLDKNDFFQTLRKKICPGFIK